MISKLTAQPIEEIRDEKKIKDWLQLRNDR